VALADILRRIDGDAEVEASAVTRAAEEEAARMRSDAEARVASTSAELLARTEALAREEGRTRVAAARLRGRDSILREKRTLIDRVLAQAVERLEALPDEAYAALLASEVARAARGGERLLVGASDDARLRRLLPAALEAAGARVTIAEEAGDFDRGVALVSGRTRVEISSAGILAARSEALEAMVANTLFEGGDPA
jgi:vacuolar-type H+-ATPase subunit E/Vma4